VRVGDFRGLRKKPQITKNRIMLATSTAFSDFLDALGNLTRKTRRRPASATSSKGNQTSSAEFIRLHVGRKLLKKS
jgi:hypothetical protein